jgi:uncharacterized membrane protein
MPEKAESPSRPKPRIESLSDMVFGLALSVGAITLVGNPPTNAIELVSDVATFAFSFLILINVWMRYTKIMSVLPLENRWTISLNTLLLFIVSIEPFLFNLFFRTSSFTSPAYYNVLAIAYGTDLGVLMLILGFFTTVLADEQRKLIPKDMMREFTYDAISFYFSAALFFVSALIPISVPGIGIPLRFDLWLIPFVISTIRRRGRNVINEVQKARSEGKSTVT